MCYFFSGVLESCKYCNNLKTNIGIYSLRYYFLFIFNFIDTFLKYTVLWNMDLLMTLIARAWNPVMF